MKPRSIEHGSVMRRPTWRQMVRHPHQFVAFSAGLGLAPFAPGTWGAAGGLFLHWALQVTPIEARVVIYVFLIVLASWAAARTGHFFNDPDHPAIVIDETIAMSIVLEGAPSTLMGVAVGFGLFRLFDIWKPWPISLVNQSSYGFAVIFDDLLAAGWSLAILFILSPLVS